MITFFGHSFVPPDGNSIQAQHVTLVPPADMADGDVVVVFCTRRAIGDTWTVSEDGGQTWTGTDDVSANTLSVRAFYCRFDGSWTADPVFSLSASGPYIVWGVVIRGADAAILDVAIYEAAFNAPSSPLDVTIPPAALTTVTDGCLLVACWISADDIAWTAQTAGLAHAGGVSQVRNMALQDMSMSVCHIEQASAGGNIALTNRQAPGAFNGYQYLVALRPASAGPAFDPKLGAFNFVPF